MEPISYMKRFQAKMEQIFDSSGTNGSMKLETRETDRSINRYIDKYNESTEDHVIRDNREYKRIQDQDNIINPLLQSQNAFIEGVLSEPINDLSEVDHKSLYNIEAKTEDNSNAETSPDNQKDTSLM